MSEVATLSRSQKAAAILVAMGKPSAGKLLKFFKQEELKSLVEAARQLRTIPQSELEKIVGEFEAEFTEGAGLLDSSDTMTSIINETLTPEEVEALMGGGATPAAAETQTPIWPRLDQLPAERLIAAVEAEHPQTIALVLSKLQPSTAAPVLRGLPSMLRGEVAKRMLALVPVSDHAMSLVEKQMRLRIEDESSARDNSAGQMRVASVLNELDKDDLDALMADMADAGTPDLEGLRAKLFSFEDIELLAQKSRVALFDSLPAELVTMALRGSTAELTEAVLSAIGARTRRMIESELKDASGAASADEVARARRRIASEAIRLSGEGRVELPSMAQAA